MAQSFQVEPVPRDRYAEAARRVAGTRDDPGAAAKAQMILRLIRDRAEGDYQFWWARRQREVLGAALMLVSPGKAGMIFYSSPAENDLEALVEVVRKAAYASIDTGVRFVQALIEPAAKADIDIVGRAGFGLLAELIYMRRELDAQSLSASPGEGQYTWRSYGEFDDEELAQVIAATYERSLDCPALAGVRKMSDVIATHRSCGLFTPESWWILEQDRRAAGCILVNDYPSTLVADVVYLGVTAPFRGRGLGRLMLRRTGRQAMERGYSTMTLAVDAGNSYAMQAYREEQFIETGRRMAYAMLAGRLTH